MAVELSPIPLAGGEVVELLQQTPQFSSSLVAVDNPKGPPFYIEPEKALSLLETDPSTRQPFFDVLCCRIRQSAVSTRIQDLLCEQARRKGKLPQSILADEFEIVQNIVLFSSHISSFLEEANRRGITLEESQDENNCINQIRRYIASNLSASLDFFQQTT